MAKENWLKRENWINKKLQGKPVSTEALNIFKRASRLSVEQLDELTRSVGISFGLSKGEYTSMDSYIYSLEEADDLQKVYDFLDRAGYEKDA